MLPTLETNRLILLPWKVEYAKYMLAFASNERIINSAGGWNLIDSEKKAKDKIGSFIRREADEWAIALKADTFPQIIGSIGMSKVAFKNLNLCFDFGYLIEEEYWGQGIAAEAAQKIIQYAFMTLKCDAMTVSHKVFNQRSKRVIEKCKFKFRGIYPKHSQDNPNAKACYYLTREDFIELFNISGMSFECINADGIDKYSRKPTPRSGNSQKQTRQVKGSPYSLESPIRKINEINYIKEPTGYLCGQSCIAMLADVPVDEVIKVIGTDKGTNKQDLKKALDYYGIRYAPKSVKYDPEKPLPDLCIIRMKLPGYGHWGVFYKGIYYDPEFGVSNQCHKDARIFQVWEIHS